MQWMIYGANGYTARLIAHEAVRRGLTPILAGRSVDKFQGLAKELGLETRAFALDSRESVESGLDGIDLVLNCAGPFSVTAEPVRAVAVAKGCHYLDITGEYRVLEASYATHETARASGSVVISGVGFDVVATDTLAALLKRELPSATTLEMAFSDGAGPSAGTAKTALESLPEGLLIRQNGELTAARMTDWQRDVPFADKSRHCVAISWGDIVTAWHSTQIPNIRVYIPMPAKRVGFMQRWQGMTKILRFKPIQRFVQGVIENKISGPTEEQLKTVRTQLWGQVSDGDKVVERTMDIPQGYQFTVIAALFCVEQLLAHRVMPGAYTPAQAFDPSVLAELEHEPAQHVHLDENLG